MSGIGNWELEIGEIHNWWMFFMPLLNSNEVVQVALLTFLAYIIGHILHYLGQQFQWLGIHRIRKSYDGINFLHEEKHLTDKLNKKCRDDFGFSIKDSTENLLKNEVDRLFEISFRILENNNMLHTTRSLQVQFVMFSNL